MIGKKKGMAKKKQKQTAESDGSFVVYCHEQNGAISPLPERFCNTKEALRYIQASANIHGSYQVQQIRSPIVRVEITEKRKLVEVEDEPATE